MLAEKCQYPVISPQAIDGKTGGVHSDLMIPSLNLYASYNVTIHKFKLLSPKHTLSPINRYSGPAIAENA
jgi:hypothetical protein